MSNRHFIEEEKGNVNKHILKVLNVTGNQRMLIGNRLLLVISYGIDCQKFKISVYTESSNTWILPSLLFGA